MPKHGHYFVAVIGGAIAGSVAAEILAEHGIRVAVMEQNRRPYGKIEDGLPRWHAEQRRQEYARIDARLRKPGVCFIPCTKLGRDVDFREICESWGFSAVILANGAWRDRDLGGQKFNRRWRDGDNDDDADQNAPLTEHPTAKPLSASAKSKAQGRDGSIRAWLRAPESGEGETPHLSVAFTWKIEGSLRLFC